MGCWNATCNVSRLPIFCGDEIVVIPLIAVSATVTANTSYATDNFVPFSFPIVGKYNDYGGIEDAVITEENDKPVQCRRNKKSPLIFGWEAFSTLRRTGNLRLYSRHIARM